MTFLYLKYRGCSYIIIRGNRGTIDSIKEFLIQGGVPTEQIKTELFFKANLTLTIRGRRIIY